MKTTSIFLIITVMLSLFEAFPYAYAEDHEALFRREPSRRQETDGEKRGESRAEHSGERRETAKPAANKVKASADAVKRGQNVVDVLEKSDGDNLDKIAKEGKLPKIDTEKKWGGFCGLKGKDENGKPVFGIDRRVFVRFSQDEKKGLLILKSPLIMNGATSPEYGDWTPTGEPIREGYFKAGDKRYEWQSPGFNEGTKRRVTLTEIDLKSQKVLLLTDEEILQKTNKRDPESRPSYCLLYPID